MTADGKTTDPGREKTDESLRTEREKTDVAIGNSQAAIDENADEVVRHAREVADAVLVAARDKADEGLARTSPPGEAQATVDQERVAEDDALRQERATADESLERERDADIGALSKLLPLEREKTDRYLLTERTRADDALAHRDDFLGMVSHDLRSLLGGMVMSAALLAQRASENDEGAKILVQTTRIERLGARMNRLIGDLVDVTSIDAGKLAVTKTRGDWASLIAEAVDIFQPAAGAKGLSLESDIHESLPGDFDHDRMLQVLANLITNAIKFTPHGGRIRVVGGRAGDECRFAVRDTGAGIPPDMLETVFERFWQVGKNDRRGLGLGLFISQCIVSAHGGRIWAESTLGEGSSFNFTLPGPDSPRVS